MKKSLSRKRKAQCNLRQVHKGIRAYIAGKPLKEVTAIAGVTRTTLYQELKRLNIPARDYDSPPITVAEIEEAAKRIRDSWAADETLARWAGQYAK